MNLGLGTHAGFITFLVPHTLYNYPPITYKILASLKVLVLALYSIIYGN